VQDFGEEIALVARLCGFGALLRLQKSYCVRGKVVGFCGSRGVEGKEKNQTQENEVRPLANPT
jgi:hypothetical protein